MSYGWPEGPRSLPSIWLTTKHFTSLLVVVLRSSYPVFTDDVSDVLTDLSWTVKTWWTFLHALTSGYFKCNTWQREVEIRFEPQPSAKRLCSWSFCFSSSTIFYEISSAGPSKTAAWHVLCRVLKLDYLFLFLQRHYSCCCCCWLSYCYSRH